MVCHCTNIAVSVANILKPWNAWVKKEPSAGMVAKKQQTLVWLAKATWCVFFLLLAFVGMAEKPKNPRLVPHVVQTGRTMIATIASAMRIEIRMPNGTVKRVMDLVMGPASLGLGAVSCCGSQR